MAATDDDFDMMILEAIELVYAEVKPPDDLVESDPKKVKHSRCVTVSTKKVFSLE